MNTVTYFVEDIDFTLLHKKALTAWIRAVITQEKFALNHLNFIFCSDSHLLEINRTYLNHEYLTDVITFNQSDNAGEIEGDIFISIDRVRENAQLYNTHFLLELHRVIIHGVLHLCGYDDKNEASKIEIRGKEDFYLSLRDKALSDN